jgi:antitoxin component YwqK of YwqJK toxin-antitoxin module
MKKKLICFLIFPFQFAISQRIQITIEEKPLLKIECLDKTSLHGRICWTYENDVLVKSFQYDSTGKLVLKRFFYQDGRIRKEINYDSDQADSCEIICNSYKSRTENCYSKGSTILRLYYDEEGKLVFQNKYNNQDTMSTHFYSNGQKMMEIHSKNGKTISEKYWNEEGLVLKPGKKVLDEPYPILFDWEEQPEFPGGYREFEKYVVKNICYPELTKEAGVQGNVFASFTVLKDGSIGKIQIIQSPAVLFARETTRVFAAQPKWKPAKMNGKPMEYTLHYVVSFRLR